MKLLGFGHVGMMIQQVQPALDFYCEKLGFSLVTDNRAAGGRGACYFIRKDNVTLELVADPENPAPRAGVLDHISLLVEDVEAAWRELLAKGVVFETDALLFDPYLYDNGEKFIMFRGPNGERLQLEQIL